MENKISFQAKRLSLMEAGTSPWYSVPRRNKWELYFQQSFRRKTHVDGGKASRNGGDNYILKRRVTPAFDIG